MSAALSPDVAKVRFEQALALLNYDQRCHQLSALGREIGAAGLPAERCEALLDSLAGSPDAGIEAFIEQSRLIVARAAGCIGYGRRLLDHPSQCVRFAAVRGKGLLRPGDAKAAFLSGESSIKLKRFLVGCRALLVDQEVLDHAWHLFAVGVKKDLERVWDLIVRVEQSELLEAWTGENGRMRQWMHDQKRIPGLPALAKRFPNAVVQWVAEGRINFSWYWAKEILAFGPMLVLEKVIMDRVTRGAGPRRAYDPCAPRASFLQTVSSWGWRMQPQMMLELASRLGWGEHNAAERVLDLAQELMAVTSTRGRLTKNTKLSYLMKLWSQLPAEQKAAGRVALDFMLYVPDRAELRGVVDACWSIANDVGQSKRRELIAGPEDHPTCTEFIKGFFRKLPPCEAVEQFFATMIEYEAAPDAYTFVMDEICASDTGEYDALMLRVFKRYLRKEGEGAVSAANMFQVLLNCAKSSDVVQSSFDLLLEHLGGLMEPGLFRTVVSRMKALEISSRQEEEGRPKIPAAELPVPVAWVRLVALAEPAPHVAFLLQVLHSGTEETSLLGAMLARHGRAFFWDTLQHVLDAPAGETLMRTQPVPDLRVLQAVDVMTLPVDYTATPPELRKQRSAVPAASKYLATAAEVKKKVYAKDPADRAAGYSDLLALARKDADQSKAYEDLLPFLVARFNVEPDAVRTKFLSTLLIGSGQSLPPELWEGKLTHLRHLWKQCVKVRDSSPFTKAWQQIGEAMVGRALRAWSPDQGPSELCIFGLEVCGCASKLPAMLVEAAQEQPRGDPLHGEALAGALRWVLETAVPVTSDAGLPLASFWETLRTLAALEKRGAERALWSRYPFVRELWMSLLEHDAKQNAADFLLVGLLDGLLDRQEEYMLQPTPDAQLGNAAKEGADDFWFAPMECEVYQIAVSAIHRQMECGEIPAKEASELLAARVSVLVRKARRSSKGGHPEWLVSPRRRRLRVEERTSAIHGGESPVETWVTNESWDLPKHHRQRPLPWGAWQCREDVAAAEVRTLAKLVRSDRQVLWRVLDVAALLVGPQIAAVVGDAISTLDPRFEGMARCIARHYPYLSCALTDKEAENGCADVLTPLLELWLLDDASRDIRVGRLMERADAENFLFFGSSFARHLANRRQEWLHQCLRKLEAPGTGPAQFFHYARRGPMLHQVAQLGHGWRRVLQSQEGLDRQGVPMSVQMYLWHPSTQDEFLSKALDSTDDICLSLLPRADYSESVNQVMRVLDRYPREQTSKETSKDRWGWEVIQAAGAYSNIASEVERRFTDLPEPAVSDVVDDAQVEILLTALGRADDASKALSVLGKYAGKVKQAKEAVTKMISQMSPPSARNIIRDVMLPRTAGVGLQMAGLNKIVELQVPDPLELYHFAWRNGHCQRDIVGSILAKVATSSEFPPDKVRCFFEFFDEADREEDMKHVADFLLSQLREAPEWRLPFLPQVVAKLALLPGVTSNAVQALLTTTTYHTEVFEALTQVVQVARLAERTEPRVKNATKATLLTDLKATISLSSIRNHLSSIGQKQKAEHADPHVLVAFLEEMLQIWEANVRACAAKGTRTQDMHEGSVLEAVLGLWVKLVRPGGVQQWPRVIDDLKRRLQARPCSPASLVMMARLLVGHASSLERTPAEHCQLLVVLREFFQGLIQEWGAACDTPGVADVRADAKFLNLLAARGDARTQVLGVWAQLLARGCAAQETEALFAACPCGHETDLAKALVDHAVARAKEARDEAERRAAKWRDARPEEGWAHAGGVPVESLRVGAVVGGTVTNSSNQHGVFVDFGCVRDGRLSVPQADWVRYHIGDRIERMVVNKVERSRNSGSAFVELLLMPSELGDAGGRLQAQGSCDVARRAVVWLASPVASRGVRWATVSRLWAAAVALQPTGAAFEESLGLLGDLASEEGMVPPCELVGLVEDLLAQNPPRDLVRSALSYLAGTCPADAVRLWPALFKPGKEESLDQRDLDKLLAMCDAQGHKLPTFSAATARGLPDAAVSALAGFRLPEARLLAVQALQEREFKIGDPPALLDALCSDSSSVVRTAAQLLQAAVGGQDVQEHSASEAEDSDWD